MTWTKIENRYYDTEIVDEINYVIKATFNDTYNECGRWTVDEFNAHETTFDQNTESEYTNIKTTLGI